MLKYGRGYPNVGPLASMYITELKIEKKNAGALPFVTSTIFFLYDKLVVNIA
jgi:hypothetical protein